jgi:hypothetical protein
MRVIYIWLYLFHHLAISPHVQESFLFKLRSIPFNFPCETKLVFYE